MTWATPTGPGVWLWAAADGPPEPVIVYRGWPTPVGLYAIREATRWDVSRWGGRWSLPAPEPQEPTR